LQGHLAKLTKKHLRLTLLLVVMGLFTKLLRVKQGQPYIDAGNALTLKFCRQWNLPGWNDGLPVYTPEEAQAIERDSSHFQAITDSQLGKNTVFNPHYVRDMRRSLAGIALLKLAREQTMGIEGFGGKAAKPDWRKVVSTYLKAWAAEPDPMTMMFLGECLERVGEKDAAKDAYRVVLNVASYTKILWGPGHNRLARHIAQLARNALAPLEP
jgi:hypothetical protein